MSVAEVIAVYFRGEKSEAALILLAGALSLVAALWLWFSVREPFARGLAAALLLTAALGLGVGGGVYFRTDTQVAASSNCSVRMRRDSRQKRGRASARS